MSYVLVMKGLRVLTVLDPEHKPCRPYEPNDVCGGCDQCQLAQAAHYGCTIRRLKGFWRVYEPVARHVGNWCWRIKHHAVWFWRKRIKGYKSPMKF